MKPNSMLWFNNWDFAGYKLLPKNEMELYETTILRCWGWHAQPAAHTSWIDARQTITQPQIPGGVLSPVPRRCPTVLLRSQKVPAALPLRHLLCGALDPESVWLPAAWRCGWSAWKAKPGSHFVYDMLLCSNSISVVRIKKENFGEQNWKPFSSRDLKTFLHSSVFGGGGTWFQVTSLTECWRSVAKGDICYQFFWDLWKSLSYGVYIHGLSYLREVCCLRECTL